MSKLNSLNSWSGNKGFFLGTSAQSYFNGSSVAAVSGSCGSACGAGDGQPKPDEKPSACGSSCGAGE